MAWCYALVAAAACIGLGLVGGALATPATARARRRSWELHPDSSPGDRPPGLGGPALRCPAGLRRLAAGLGVVGVGSGRSFDADVVATLDSMSSALVAGASLGQAVVAASSRPTACGADLRHVIQQVDAGAAMAPTLDSWAEYRAGSAVPLVVDALAIAAATGASSRAAVEAAAGTIRRRLALGREVRALASQSSASAAVLVALPVAFLVVASSVDQRVGHLVLGTPVGWLCLLAGLALDVVGGWWMARLVARVR